MARDIDLYLASKFCGRWSLDTIESYFDEYEEMAEKASEIIDWDEVILYAIFAYDGERQTIISADFMLLRIDCSRYEILCKKLSSDCRLFIKKNIKE